MKKKPRVVSNYFVLRANSTKDGANVAVPAALVDATGLSGVQPSRAIAEIKATHPIGYKPRSGASSARNFVFVDVGVPLARGMGAVNPGGTLNLTGAFKAGKTGKKGTVLKGNVNGYVTSSTGIFAAQGLSAGTPFTGTLERDGTRWRVNWVNRFLFER